MTPATGATGKPLSFLFTDTRGRARLADAESCPHTRKTLRSGEWKCARCGEPCPF